MCNSSLMSQARWWREASDSTKITYTAREAISVPWDPGPEQEGLHSALGTHTDLLFWTLWQSQRSLGRYLSVEGVTVLLTSPVHYVLASRLSEMSSCFRGDWWGHIPKQELISRSSNHCTELPHLTLSSFASISTTSVSTSSMVALQWQQQKATINPLLMMIGKEVRSPMSKDERDWGTCAGGGQEKGLAFST